MTELAAAIAPAPQTTSGEVISALFFVEFLVAIMALLSLLVLKTGSSERISGAGIAGMLFLPLFSVALLVFIGWQIVKAFRTRSLVRKGQPRAILLWRAGRYCFRCGVVTAESGLFEPLEFRQLVWNQGGYGHLPR
jgi:hypothetical protein